MALFSTGPIENMAVNGQRETIKVVVRIVNQSSLYGVASIEGYQLLGSRELYAIETFSVGPQESITKEYYANLDGYEFVVLTSGEAANSMEVSVWGKNADNLLVAAHRLVTEENRQERDGNSPQNPDFVEVVNNSPANPITTRALNSFEDPSVTVSQSTAAARAGRFFAVTSGPIEVFGNGFAILQIINPPTSPDTLSIERISAGTPQNTLISFYLNGIPREPGTPIIPVNSIAGYGRPSNTQCQFELLRNDPVTSGTLYETFIQSGIGGIQFIEFEGRIIIPPGNTFLLLLSNLAGLNSLASLNVAWSEFPLAIPPLP